jgi:PKD repeat protein
MYRKAVSSMFLAILIIGISNLGCIVRAAKFNLGDTVEVVNTGSSGLRVRDAAAGNVIGTKYDGEGGMILAGPQSAALGGVVYTWWKIRWQDSTEGWSSEGYPGGVDYLKYVYVSPSTKFSIGGFVKVYNTGTAGLVVRTDPPVLTYKGNVVDGTVGKVIQGPFYGIPEGKTGFNYFWKIDYGSITGWSAEDWLTMATPSDLTVEDIWIDPTRFDPVSTVTIYTRIKNTGGSNAISDQGLRIICHFDGSVFQEEAIEGLGVGYSYTFLWSRTWPSDANSHSIDVRVDPNNYIIESDENNNHLSRSFASQSLDDFSITTSPTSLTIQQGNAATSVVTVGSINSFAQPVQLNVLGAPSEVTATFNPEQVTPALGGSVTSTLTVSVTTTATPGSYTLAVTGTSGAITHNVYVSLQIAGSGDNPPNPPTLLSQLDYVSGNNIPIPVGGISDKSSILLAGVISDPDGDSVKLQVELRRLDEYGGMFNEAAGGFKENESWIPWVFVFGLINGDYHWRARAVDEHGLASEWVEFGNNDISEADFTIVSGAKAMPPWFDFGTIYVNSIVEASCLIVDAQMIGIKSVPDWIILDSVDLQASYSTSGAGRGVFEFHVDTSVSGLYSEAIVVETSLGDVAVSLSSIVRSTPAPKLRMLVYDSPFDKQSTENPENFEPMTRVMDMGRVNVSYSFHFLPPEQYDLVLLTWMGVMSATNDQVDMFKNYIRNGGNLIVCADYFLRGSVGKGNQIINEFGLSMRDEEYGFIVEITDFAVHPVTAGVSHLHLLRPSPIEALTSEATVLARPPGAPQTEGVLAISEQLGGGKLIVLGDSLWWYSFLKYGDGYDNSRVFLNIFDCVSAPKDEPPTCVVSLQKDMSCIIEVDVGECFDICVGDSTDDKGIQEVRFLSDELQNGQVDEGFKWTDWYDWSVSSGDWNAETKVKRWSFATEGRKEIWVEVNDTAGNVAQNDADIVAKEWTFAIITDLHIGFGYPDYGTEGWEKDAVGDFSDYYLTDRLREIVETINSMKNSENIRFVVVLGDISDTAEYSEFLKAREILEGLNDPNGDGNTADGIPYIPVMGNHDVWPYTQQADAPKDGEFNPDGRDRLCLGTESSYANGDEFFEEVFWSEQHNVKNIECITRVFGSRGEKWDRQLHTVNGRDDESHLQNYVFKYRGINFVTLDCVAREPSLGWGLGVGGDAVLWPRTLEWLTQNLHSGEPTILLSHHPLVAFEPKSLTYAFDNTEINGVRQAIYVSGARVLSTYAGHMHGNKDFSGSSIQLGADVTITESVLRESKVDWYELLWVTQTGMNVRIVRPRGITEPEESLATGWPDEPDNLRPISYFYFEPENPRVGHWFLDDTEFKATSYDPDGTIGRYEWDFDDGSSGFGTPIPHIYRQAGEYTVTLTVTDSGGTHALSSSFRRTVVVRPSPSIWEALLDSPVDLVVTDPDGFTLTKNVAEVAGMSYTEVDVDGDGELEDVIAIWEQKIGDYSIKVVPEPDALATDTYSLKVWTGDTITVLAENVQISSIPSLPYVIRSTGTETFPITWEYIFEDPARGTKLGISTNDKYFQFIAPNKDYGIRKATYMKQYGTAIVINHLDKQLQLITTAIDTKLDFCVAIAWDRQTRKQYFLIDKPGIEK